MFFAMKNCFNIKNYNFLQKLIKELNFDDLKAALLESLEFNRVD